MRRRLSRQDEQEIDNSMTPDVGDVPVMVDDEFWRLAFNRGVRDPMVAEAARARTGESRLKQRLDGLERVVRDVLDRAPHALGCAALTMGHCSCYRASAERALR